MSDFEIVRVELLVEVGTKKWKCRKPSSWARLLHVVVACLVSDAVFAAEDDDFNAEQVSANDACHEIVVPGQAPFDISSVDYEWPTDLIPANAVIGDIVITRYRIFNHDDPAENYALYRFADYLHIDTLESTIREKLIFEPGDHYQQRVLEESARILRRLSFLYDARVWPYRICGNRVDIEVVTRDLWTISGGVSVSRSGGNDKTRFSVVDSNFLGRGELLSFSKVNSTDRNGVEVGYSDPSVAGTHHYLDLSYADNDDGSLALIKMGRPFYSLDTTQAWGVFYDKTVQANDFYEEGEEIASFQSHEHRAEVYWGLSRGLKSDITKRWWFGLHYETEDYDPIVGETPPALFPPDREINYPWIGFDRIEENYIKATNLNQIHRIEDFNLGASYSWRLGFSSENFGSDRDRLVYRGSYHNGWRYNDKILMQLELGLEGMWRRETNDSEDVKLISKWRYYRGASRYIGTYFALDMTYAYDLPAHEQLLLGNDEGLRGYPSRYQDGDRSFLFTAERRFFNDWHIFRLLRVGGAVFFDAGRAWFPSDKKEGASDVLYDVGFGIRLASTRAESNKTYNIDIAFPINPEDDVDSYQISLTARQSF